MPVAAPFGIAPALVLTAAAVEGLMGIVTAAWGAFMAVIVAIILGRQGLGPFVETGFVIEQPSLFDPARAAETKSALLNVLIASNDRFGPLGTVLDAATLWSQLAGVVSRIVGSDVAAIATVLAWTVAALAVWTVTRVLRTFFDTLLRRPGRWFALYVLAQAVGTTTGASILFMLFITWGPLAKAAGRPAESVLLLSAFVCAILATAASVVISATSHPEQAEEPGLHLSGRRATR
jgi:hypothetical protein